MNLRPKGGERATRPLSPMNDAARSALVSRTRAYDSVSSYLRSVANAEANATDHVTLVGYEAVASGAELSVLREIGEAR